MPLRRLRLRSVIAGASVVMTMRLTLNAAFVRRSCLVVVFELLIEIPGVENLLSVGNTDQLIPGFPGVFVSLALALLLDLAIEIAEPWLAGNQSNPNTSHERKTQ